MTVKLTGEDVLPPDPGLKTVTGILPAVAPRRLTAFRNADFQECPAMSMHLSSVPAVRRALALVLAAAAFICRPRRGGL